MARWLADQGHSAQHVNNVGLTGAEDFVIWNHAFGVDAIIVTKDFAERTARTTVGPVIVWLRIGNAPNRALLEAATRVRFPYGTPILSTSTDEAWVSLL